MNLDLVVITETKLTKETSNEELKEKLGEFNLLKRYDANDGKKHMGMLLMSPKKSNYTRFDQSMLEGFKYEPSQGLIYGMMSPLYLRFALLYIRPNTGTK